MSAVLLSVLFLWTTQFETSTDVLKNLFLGRGTPTKIGFSEGGGGGGGVTFDLIRRDFSNFAIVGDPPVTSLENLVYVSMLMLQHRIYVYRIAQMRQVFFKFVHWSSP